MSIFLILYQHLMKLKNKKRDPRQSEVWAVDPGSAPFSRSQKRQHVTNNKAYL
jgi:hypothetical protein